MKQTILLLAFACLAGLSHAQAPRDRSLGAVSVPQNADVLQIAKKMIANGGEYEADINGAFAQLLRKQLQDDKLRVSMKGKVLEKLPDGCVWAEFTTRTPDKIFTTVIKDRYVVRGPFEFKLNGKYCDNPDLYTPDNN